MKHLNQLPLTKAFRSFAFLLASVCLLAPPTAVPQVHADPPIIPASTSTYCDDGWFEVITPTSKGFSPASELGSGDIRGTALGDFNGDGQMDIVFAAFDQPSQIFLNNGSGQFTLAATVGINQMTAVAVGDLNNDGVLDIVLGRQGQPSEVYVNDGSGRFTRTATLGGGSQTTSVAVGDFNGDSALDIVFGNNNSPSQIYLNNGAGGFTLAATLGGSQTTSIAVGDFDSDDALDLVLGNYNSPSQVYFNNGRGAFALVTTLGGDRTVSVAAGDFNGDGILDLVLGNEDPKPDEVNGEWHPSQVYINNGARGFTLLTALLSPGNVGEHTSAQTKSVAIGDMNGDGLLDVVLGNYWSWGNSAAEVYLNTGSDTFVYTRLPLIGSWTNAVAIGDVNRDGALDIVLGDPGTSISQVYLNNGTTQFMLTPHRLGPYGTGIANSKNMEAAAVGDVNGDGALDIVLGANSSCGNASQIYLNDGAGNFGSPNQLGNAVSTYAVALADLDGDNALDIVLGNGNTPSQVYLNNGTGGFTQPSTIGNGGTRAVAIGDLNGDQRLDIVLGNYYRESEIYFNDGQGRFTLAKTIGSGSADAIAFGDLNGDGALDIVLGSDNSLSQIYVNDGNGGFTLAGTLGRAFTRGVAIGDLNGDSLLDIVLNNYATIGQIYFNNGSGGFTTGQNLGGGDLTGGLDVALGDLNGDGTLDVVLGTEGQSHVYLNKGAGEFTKVKTLGNRASSGIALGDLNGDGMLDVVLAQWTDPSVFYLNGTAQTARLPNNSPRATITRPGPTRDTNFYSTPWILDDRTIPIAYTLSDPEGDPVRFIRAFYSPDGGGKWYTAAASGTITTDLPTSLGSAIKFDGVNDYINVPHSNSLNPLNEVTMEAWVKLDDASRNQKIVGKTPMGSGYLLGVANHQIYPEIWDTNGTDHSFTAGSIPSNQWTHLAVTWRSGGQMIGYINGTPVMTITASVNAIASNTNVLRIGASPWYGDYPVMGTIDDVRLYRRALSAVEIRAGMYQSLQGNEAGLTAYWRLDEGTGAIIRDRTANHNDGTLVNGPTWVRGHVPAPVAYTYNWDTFASGFFGQSDDVVFRIEAYPSYRPMPNTVPGPYQRPYASATTFPFRVRGTQVLVLDRADKAVPNALVYRLPKGQERGAELMGSAAAPYRTDPQGYLQGRGQLVFGDRLVALAPVQTKNGYTLYHTSAAPNEAGLDLFTISQSGVQTLRVSPDHKLILFDLDVALEWDARKDDRFMAQLDFDLKRTSELLFDWTDGQVALGKVRVFHDARRVPEANGFQPWYDAHIRIQATNRLRPWAAQGGIVDAALTDSPQNPNIVYEPGQVHMGAVWNRYGEAGGSLGEDWPRTLAHELGHYLLYLDDNYMGLDPSGVLAPIATCPGAMADPYRDDYSEFDPDAGWLSACANTLSNLETGRSDWATIDRFYKGLTMPAAFNSRPGPRSLPLAVTQVAMIEPSTASSVLDVPIFYLSNESGASTDAGNSARAFLLQGDWLTDLGRPTVGEVRARGARPGDRVCVFEPERDRLGCETITPGDDLLRLDSISNWQPEIRVSPVTSTTISVHVGNVPAGLTLNARLYPAEDPAMPAIPLNPTIGGYEGTFPRLPEPALDGHVHVYATGGRETITDYTIGGNPGHVRSGAGHVRSGAGHVRSGAAPAMSSDGQVIVFGRDLTFAVGEFYVVQAATRLPALPIWTKAIGQGYWLTASAHAPNLANASISFQYLGSQVPAGEESFIKIYFWDGAQWLRLDDTTHSVEYNIAAARTRGPGLYALMSSIEIPLYGPGWNLFAYPVLGQRPPAEALASISGHYRIVYGYDANTGKWEVYDPSAPAWVNDLKNLHFGRGYWLNATDDITLLLKGASASSASSTGGIGLPPATYYGKVAAAPGFSPVTGMAVHALVDGVLCGEGEVMEVEGDLVYVIKVLADGAGTSAGTRDGCGAQGRQVMFEVGSQSMTVAAGWDNERAHELRLTSEPVRSHVYLPLITRH